MPPQRYPVKFVLIPILLAVLIAISPLSAADGGLVVREQQRNNSFIVPPGSTETVTVSVVRADGTPVPGVGVLFGAPVTGPSGVFPASMTVDQRTLSNPVSWPAYKSFD
jgi:hypothetical protein